MARNNIVDYSPPSSVITATVVDGPVDNKHKTQTKNQQNKSYHSVILHLTGKFRRFSGGKDREEKQGRKKDKVRLKGREIRTLYFTHIVLFLSPVSLFL